MSVSHDIFWTKAQVKFFSQEILPKNEEMAAILDMTKFSWLDRNNAIILRICHVVERVCYNIQCICKKIRQLSIIENIKLNI